MPLANYDNTAHASSIEFQKYFKRYEFYTNLDENGLKLLPKEILRYLVHASNNREQSDLSGFAVRIGRFDVLFAMTNKYSVGKRGYAAIVRYRERNLSPEAVTRWRPVSLPSLGYENRITAENQHFGLNWDEQTRELRTHWISDVFGKHNGYYGTRNSYKIKLGSAELVRIDGLSSIKKGNEIYQVLWEHGKWLVTPPGNIP